MAAVGIAIQVAIGKADTGIGHLDAKLAIPHLSPHADAPAFRLGFNAMPDGVFDQRLQHHGRKNRRSQPARNLDVELQPLLDPQLEQFEVGPYQRDLTAQRGRILAHLREGCPQVTDQRLLHHRGPLGIGFDQIIHRCERIEQKVRLHLGLQQLEACLDQLALNGLTLRVAVRFEQLGVGLSCLAHNDFGRHHISKKGNQSGRKQVTDPPPQRLPHHSGFIVFAIRIQSIAPLPGRWIDLAGSKGTGGSARTRCRRRRSLGGSLDLANHDATAATNHNAAAAANADLVTIDTFDNTHVLVALAGITPFRRIDAYPFMGELQPLGDPASGDQRNQSQSCHAPPGQRSGPGTKTLMETLEPGQSLGLPGRCLA